MSCKVVDVAEKSSGESRSDVCISCGIAVLAERMWSNWGVASSKAFKHLSSIFRAEQSSTL